MARNLSTDFLTEFIELYRDFPCLWKIKSKEYLNRHLRNQAYERLVEFSKTAVPEANKDFVVKKINSLRGAFRKELKKVKACTHSGMSTDDIYEPTLWYYKLLLFTADQESNRETKDSLSQDEKENNTVDDLSASEEVLAESESQPNDTEEPQVYINKQIEQLDTAQKKKKLKRSKNVNEEAYSKAIATLNKTEDEYDGFAISVACKLRKLDERQRFYCENLINKVLFKASLGQLSEHSDIQVPHFSATQTQYFPYQSFNSSNQNLSPIAPSTSGEFIPLIPNNQSSTTTFRINDLLMPL